MTRQLVGPVSYAVIFAALLAATISGVPLRADAQSCVGQSCPFRQEHKQQQRAPAPVYIPAPPQQQQQQAPAASVYIAAPPPQQQPPSMPVYVPQPQQGPAASGAQPPSAPFYLPPPPQQPLSSACGTPAGFCAAIQPLGTACQCSDDSGNIFSGIAQ
jgi:hypothetical protein